MFHARLSRAFWPMLFTDFHLSQFIFILILHFKYFLRFCRTKIRSPFISDKHGTKNVRPTQPNESLVKLCACTLNDYCQTLVSPFMSVVKLKFHRTDTDTDTDLSVRDVPIV